MLVSKLRESVLSKGKWFTLSSVRLSTLLEPSMDDEADARSEHPVVPVALRPASAQGSRKSRYMRRDRRVPSLLFGKDNDGNELNVPISLASLDVNRLIRLRGRSLECTLMTLKMDDGKRILVTPKGLQLCPLTEQPLSINFRAYLPGNSIRVPFSFVNEELSVALKRGSFLQRINKSMEITCDPGIPLPPSIPVDLTGKGKGEVITLKEVVLPRGVHVSKKTHRDLVIAKVSASRGGAK